VEAERTVMFKIRIRYSV